MGTIPVSMSATEAGKILQALRSWVSLTPPTTKERLDDLVSKLDSRELRAPYVADLLGTLLAENLADMSRGLDEASFHKYVRWLVGVFQDSLEDFLTITRNIQLYLEGLREVWLACEPMLDLVEGEDGWQETLIQTLRSRRIPFYYFLSDRDYFDHLLEALRSRGLDDDELSLLSFIRIDQPYVPPVALWLAGDRRIGLRSRWRPEIEQDSTGKFILSRPLPLDWLSLMTDSQSETHYQELNRHKSSGET